VRLHVLYFGLVRERLGRRTEELECEAGTTVSRLLELLAGRHDIFSLGAGSIRVAVNREYVDGSHVLSDADEVAIIPPVAGGRR
jgi:molybdopterin converting factor subunit 1